MRPAVCPAASSAAPDIARNTPAASVTESTALPALAVRNIGARDVLNSKQHLAIAPERERGSERHGIRAGGLAVPETLLKAIEARAERAELREDHSERIFG